MFIADNSNVDSVPKYCWSVEASFWIIILLLAALANMLRRPLLPSGVPSFRPLLIYATIDSRFEPIPSVLLRTEVKLRLNWLGSAV